MTVVKERSEVLQELGQSFKRTTAALRRLRGRETHRPGELSYAQYILLFGLAAGGELSAGELASSADLSPGTVTQMLDGLTAAGLVERVRSERDKRVVLVSLTDRGESVVAARRARRVQRARARDRERGARPAARAVRADGRRPATRRGRSLGGRLLQLDRGDEVQGSPRARCQRPRRGPDKTRARVDQKRRRRDGADHQRHVHPRHVGRLVGTC
jgi:DNA-binding MarR family transcriptional regulator